MWSKKGWFQDIFHVQIWQGFFCESGWYLNRWHHGQISRRQVDWLEVILSVLNFELFFPRELPPEKSQQLGECDFECESPDFGLRDPDILLHRRGWDAFEIRYISYISHNFQWTSQLPKHFFKQMLVGWMSWRSDRQLHHLDVVFKRYWKGWRVVQKTSTVEGRCINLDST